MFLTLGVSSCSYLNALYLVHELYRLASTDLIFLKLITHSNHTCSYLHEIRRIDCYICAHKTILFNSHINKHILYGFLKKNQRCINQLCTKWVQKYVPRRSKHPLLTGRKCMHIYKLLRSFQTNGSIYPDFMADSHP